MSDPAPNPQSPGLSAVVVTGGPSVALPERLARVRACVDEVILLDLSREGQTTTGEADVRRVAAGRESFADLGEAYRHAMAHATGDWVLLLGPTEEPAGDFRTALHGLPDADLGSVDVVETFRERTLTSGGPTRSLRLARRGRGATIAPTIRFADLEFQADGAAVAPVDATITRDWLSDLDATLRARDLESDWELRARPGRASVLELLTALPRGFLTRYFGRGGWRDGTAGFYLACLGAAHHFSHAMKRWIAERPAEFEAAELEAQEKGRR